MKEYISQLFAGDYFTFKGKNIVYYVADIKYHGDYFGTYTMYYCKKGSSVFYKWVSNQKDKQIISYS